MNRCRMSIIVPAHNAGRYLEKCLAALRQESDQGTEMIVVDDASTDDTGKMAESMGARVFRMERNAGPSRARNFGARQAAGEYLFFVDADVVVRPGAVSRVKTFLDDHPQTAAVFGSYDAAPLEEGVVTQYRNLLHHYVHQNGRKEASTFWSGCGAIRRSVFEEMNGFDETGYPICIEDIELGYRLRQAGHAVSLDRGLLCTHLKRWSIGSVIKTDVFCRALPWTKLNFLRNVSPDDLNIKKSQKASVLLTALGFLFLLVSVFNLWYLVATGAAVLLITLLNGAFFNYILRQRGLFFMLTCVPLHVFYFFYSGLSYLYVWLAFKLKFPVRDGNYAFRKRYEV